MPRTQSKPQGYTAGAICLALVTSAMLAGAPPPEVADAAVAQAPPLRADPVDFGAAQVGTSVQRTATIENATSEPVLVGAVDIIGANADDFALGPQTCTGAFLQRGDSCFVQVSFAPAVVGARSAQLLVTTVRPRGRLAVRLSGVGTTRPVEPAGPELAADPNPVDFGQRLPLADGPDKTVTVTNTGDSPLKVGSPAIEQGTAKGAPEDFAVAGNGCTKAVAPGQKCTIVVGFHPSRPGPRAAALVLTGNDGSGPAIIRLRGRGARQVIEVNPGVVRPGRVTTVTGTGFPPDRKISVRVAGFAEATTSRTRSNGKFTAQLLLFPKARPGQRTVRARVDGVSPALGSDTRLLVVYGTASAPDFHQRR